MNEREFLNNILESEDEDKHAAFLRYLLAQKDAIEAHKWIMGEKLHRDPGDEAVKDWIDKYAKQFREEWEKTHGE